VEGGTISVPEMVQGCKSRLQQKDPRKWGGALHVHGRYGGKKYKVASERLDERLRKSRAEAGHLSVSSKDGLKKKGKKKSRLAFKAGE